MQTASASDANTVFFTTFSPSLRHGRLDLREGRAKGRGIPCAKENHTYIARVTEPPTGLAMGLGGQQAASNKH